MDSLNIPIRRNFMRFISKQFLLVLLTLIGLNIHASGNKESETNNNITEDAGKAKYVFLFIGDGMAMPQLSAAEAYLSAKSGDNANFKKLAMSNFPAQGLTTTYSSNALITDSAAAGTAIATGQKTESGVIAMDPTKQVKLKTLAEIAKEAGKKIGIVSSVNLDHATPATFYAHSPSRKNYYDINIEMANSNFDYFAGGMVRIDKTPDGQKNAHEVMKERGWDIASTRDELNKLTGEKQIYAYNKGFAGNALDYAIDQDSEDITLPEFTRKGIEVLYGEEGFFLMVEGGKVDWACHANDAAASIKNTIAFDNAVKEAIEFYNEHPDETLIVVTGDHETGGLTLGFAGTKYGSAFEKIDNQTMSHEGFNSYVLKPFIEKHGLNAKLADLLPEIEKAFGLKEFSAYEMDLLEKSFTQSMIKEDDREESDETYLLYGGYEPITVTLTHILNQRAGLAWTSYSHTGVPVPTFAMGVTQNSFNGYYDNTDIFTKLHMAMGL